MNLAQVTPIEIQNWTKEQTCAALVEAKKIERIIDLLKSEVRARLTTGEVVKVSNGEVTIRTPGVTFSHRETLVSQDYLLPAIRPLNKKKVRAHYDDTGDVPTGVSLKLSKPSVVVTLAK